MAEELEIKGFSAFDIGQHYIALTRTGMTVGEIGLALDGFIGEFAPKGKQGTDNKVPAMVVNDSPDREGNSRNFFI